MSVVILLIHNIMFHLWVNGRALYYFTNQCQTKSQNEILEMLKSGMAVLTESGTVNLTSMTGMLDNIMQSYSCLQT